MTAHSPPRRRRRAARHVRRAPARPTRAGVNCRTVEVDGHPRQYLVYVPHRRAARAPVVFMHHGSSGDGERFLRISGWREQADRTGLIAVFPTGLRYRMLDTGRRITKWNDYNLARTSTSTTSRPAIPADAPWPAERRRLHRRDARRPRRAAADRPPAGLRLRLLQRRRSSPPGSRSSAPRCSPPRRTRPAASTRRARSRRGRSRCT